MARTDGFLRRDCPLCSGEAPAKAEVASGVAAEAMGYEELTPYWNGFFKEKTFFSYARCPTCSLLYNPTFFEPGQLAELYGQMPANMEMVPTPALRATQRGYYEVLRRQARFEHGYLEVGPDVGLFTENCVKAGGFDRYWLFEPNRDVAPALTAVVRDETFTLVHDMFDFDAAPDASIGVAVMIHVLDHLLDPLEALRILRRKLAPGGKLLIVTHDESSLLRKVFGGRWPPFCLQHPQLYSPRSMRGLIEAAGYGGATIAKTVNHFPLDFLLKQLLWASGLKVEQVPRLGDVSVGLKLGNMLTLASA